MHVPVHTIGQALGCAELPMGWWVGLADAKVAEAWALTGDDGLLLAGEHAPKGPAGAMAKLHAWTDVRSVSEAASVTTPGGRRPGDD